VVGSFIVDPLNNWTALTGVKAEVGATATTMAGTVIVAVPTTAGMLLEVAVMVTGVSLVGAEAGAW
jgi:hypothetical protein